MEKDSRQERGGHCPTPTRQTGATGLQPRTLPTAPPRPPPAGGAAWEPTNRKTPPCHAEQRGETLITSRSRRRRADGSSRAAGSHHDTVELAGPSPSRARRGCSKRRAPTMTAQQHAQGPPRCHERSRLPGDERAQIHSRQQPSHHNVADRGNSPSPPSLGHARA